MYELIEGTWLTPGGHPVIYTYRQDTNDYNTILSTTSENDEYRLRGMSLSGWALDIGGYLGTVAIGLLLDNPDLRVVCVEPVPPNAELIQTNAYLNGVSDRLELFQGAAGGPDDETSEIRFGYLGDPNLEHHAFVGNTSLSYDTGGDVTHTALEVPTWSLAKLLDHYQIDEPMLVKIDCEGGEWSILSDRETNKRCPLILGEAHPVRGHAAKDIIGLLPDHDVSLIGPNTDPGPCGFTAVWR